VQLPVSLQEDFLGDVFHLAALAKELTGHLKDAGTIAPNDLFESVLIALASAPNQLLVGNFCSGF